ncbi:hypothetical protein NDU88_001004 [Pleurodeles waltl]|uniref:Uncharacterized protein n=1 Tax=Pleurodeles waltl TaxID=8319 RepID=A0AAV7MJC3_PLEWA|nr:hypothetical protein NDU88_001004 [Pleurodeles waltl]
MVKPKASNNPTPLGWQHPASGVVEFDNRPLRHLEATLDRHTTQYEHIQQTMLNTKTALQSKINLVSLAVGLLCADHRKLVDRVDDGEFTLTTMRSTVQDLHPQVKEMKADILYLQLQVEDAKGHCRSNVRSFGFPELVEGPYIKLFSNSGYPRQ